ncbi:MAG: hypothetical protein AAFQ53_17980, partial [Bacteroidota bacterium]
ATHLAPLVDQPVEVQANCADGVDRRLVFDTTVTAGTVTRDAGCPLQGTMRLDLDVTLSSPDGLFDESWQTKAKFGARNEDLAIAAEFEVAEINGTFPSSEFAKGPADIVIVQMTTGPEPSSALGGSISIQYTDDAPGTWSTGVCGWGNMEDRYQDRPDTGPADTGP